MTEPVPAPPPPAFPVKTPQRLRQEEALLWVFRVVLLVATIWAGIYGWIGIAWPQERLDRLATETIHGTLQFGVTVFLGAELAYYLYLSSAMRGCREWGMAIWAAGLVAVAMNLRFAVG